jgi:hypothetical protein
MGKFKLAIVVAGGLSLAMVGGAPAKSGGARRPTLDFSSIVLRAPQVGPGYRAHVIPGGLKVRGQVTLDLCGFKYRSEALRTERIQLAYKRRGSALQLSNEVVRYRAGGSSLALREVAHAVAHCPRGPVTTPYQGLSQVVFRIKTLRFPGLLPRSIALQIHVSGSSQGQRFSLTSIGVYQVRGPVLSGVYTAGGSIAAQKRFALHAAHQSAKNLKAA